MQKKSLDPIGVRFSPGGSGFRNAPVHVRGNAPSVRAGEGMVKSGVLRIAASTRFDPLTHVRGHPMNGIIYIVGLVVVVVALLSFFGLR